MTRRRDVIVVGAGHNGLTTAAYLARAGLDVLVLERRERVGGATVTEELLPGYHYSVFSYLVSLLQPEVIQDLELVKHGLFVVPLESTFNPLPSGDFLYREADPQKTYRNLCRHSPRDAEAYFEFKVAMHHVAHLVHRLQRVLPPELPSELLAAELPAASLWPELGRHLDDAPREHLLLLVRMMSASAEDFLDSWFESDALKAALSTSSIIGSFLSPRSPGSAYVLLHHYMGELHGQYREWGWAKGGTGAVAEAIASSARSHGVEIQLEAPVASLTTEAGRVSGVALESGDELSAGMVVSSLAPRPSLLELPPAGSIPESVLEQVRAWQSAGCSGKVNLALSELPQFAARPDERDHLAGGISIAPSINYIDRAYKDAKWGAFSRQPFIDMVVPSVIDPDMAPTGHHVMSCFVQYAPYDLEGGWNDERRDAFGGAVMDVLEEYMPGIGSTVLHRQVLTPVDIERIVGIPGGNIFHGELRTSQLLGVAPRFRLGAIRDAASGLLPVRFWLPPWGWYLRRAGTFGGTAAAHGSAS